MNNVFLKLIKSKNVSNLNNEANKERVPVDLEVSDENIASRLIN